MISNTILVKTAASYSVGLTAYADGVVDYGPPAVVHSVPSSGLEFRVYDPSNVKYLGTIQSRQNAQWTEELNGKGMGRISALLSDDAVSRNPSLFADDNVIRAHFLGDDRFAWRVKAGRDNLISSGEHSDETIGLDGPGVFDLLEEAIVFPEYPITGDPTREASERYFGYMSLHEPTQVRGSRSFYNRIVKPRVTSTADWSVVVGDSTGTASVSSETGLDEYDTWMWTYGSSGSDEVRIQYNQSRAVPVTSYQKVSLSVWVLTSEDVPVSLGVDFDTDSIEGTRRIAYADEPTELVLENINAPIGSSSFVPSLRIFGEAHSAGTTVEIFWPLATYAPSVPSYFDGGSLDANNYSYYWSDTPNNSYSYGYYSAEVIPYTLQPSWYDASIWGQEKEDLYRRYGVRNGGLVFATNQAKKVKAVKKSQVKKGTAKAAPDDWRDPTAYVIWSSDPQKPSAPGTIYWRNYFTMPKKASVFLQAAADNQLRVWIDGVEVITQGFNGDATDITGSWDGTLDAGRHLIAAETTNFNYSKPGENFGWFLATVMYKVKNEPVGVVTHTDATWLAYYEGQTNVPSKNVTTTSGKSSSTTKKTPVKYTVRKGDTLTKIGKKYGIAWKKIYNANKAKIDARAKKSGLPNNGPGWWIFPGQVLVIPGKYTTTSTKGTKKTTTKTVWSAGTALTTQQPGWYPYQILVQLILEAQRRQVSNFHAVTYGFEFGFDSDGVAWDTGYEAIVDRSFRIGSSVYDAVQQLIEGGIDVRMAPDYTLLAYREMGEYRGINTDRQQQFHLWDKGGTTLSYYIDKRTDLKNFMLIDTDRGWRAYSNRAGDEPGRSESGASLGGVNADKISQAIGSELEELGKKTKTVTTEFVVQAGRVPYIDFDLGDTVVARDAFGRPFDVRIVTLSVKEHENHLTCEVVASGEGL